MNGGVDVLLPGVVYLESSRCVIPGCQLFIECWDMWCSVLCSLLHFLGAQVNLEAWASPNNAMQSVKEQP